MSILSAVIDKSLLQQGCELPKEQSDLWVSQLREKYQPVVSLVLVEEVLANRFQSAGVDQRTVSKMIEAILSFHPLWLKHPLELVFRELVLGESIGACVWLPPVEADRVHEALTNPDSASPNLSEWVTERNEEKKKRRDLRKVQQNIYQEEYPQFLHAPDMLGFVQNGKQILKSQLESPDEKTWRLEAYLGRAIRRWHPDRSGEIDAAFLRLEYSRLKTLPFTHGNLLAEILYDFGPITQIGPNKRGIDDPLVLSGSQINNEEDQEYVASALNLDRLVTCDSGMYKIADAIHDDGHWKGRCILIPPDQVHDLGRFLR